MTIALNLIDPDSDFFQDWLDRTNLMISALAGNIVTVNSHANGSASIGNGFIAGILAGTTLAASTLRGGNVQTSNTLILGSNVTMNTSFSFISGNVVANSTVLLVGANVSLNSSSWSVGNSTVNTFSNSSSLFTNFLSFGTGSSSNSLSVGSNVSLNSTTFFVGNSTANLFANSILFKVANSTGIANLTPTQLVIGTSVVNSTMLAIGANVLANTTSVFVGNSTINAVMNSSQISVGANISLSNILLSMGNSTANHVGNSIFLGISNSTSSANLDPIKLVISLSTVNSTAISVGSNVVANATSFKLDQIVIRPIHVTTTGISAQEIDAIALATYRSVEYTMTIKDNSANNFQISKMLLVHDGGAVYLTEYGIVRSNSVMGTFATGSNATHFSITFTPVSSNTTLKGSALTSLV